MRIALAQLSTVVGDLDGNVERIVGADRGGGARLADLVLFPSWPSPGIRRRPAPASRLRPRGRAAVEEIARSCTDTVGLVGCPTYDRDLANAAFVCADGEVRGLPQALPPELRRVRRAPLLRAGRELLLLELGGVVIAPTICEDVWQPGPPATDLALAGATLLVNLSASPFHVGKAEEREEMLVTRARDNAVYVAFCNLVGGQDELVFDGLGRARRRGRGDRARPGSRRRCSSSTSTRPRRSGAACATCSGGTSRGRSPRLRRRRRSGSARRGTSWSPCRRPSRRSSQLEQMRLALGLGLRDYVTKNGFGDVVLGISGGIDSALVLAAVAPAPCGAERIHGLDAVALLVGGDATTHREVSVNLGVDFREMPIEGIVARCTRRSAGSKGSPPRTSRRGSAARC